MMAESKEQNRLDRLEKLAEEMFTGIAHLRESHAKTDEQLNKTDEQLRKTIQKLDNIGSQLGDLGLVQGEVAEDLFFRNLRGVFKKARIDLKKVKRNLKRKGEGEFDLVAENDDKVLVVEVKNKLEKRMVDKFLEKKLPRFKELFPEYEKYRPVRLRIVNFWNELLIM